MTAPVSESPLDPVQTAIYERLTGDATLMALVTGVFDQVPEGQEHPYIRIGDHLSIPDNDHSSFGREITVTIHIWSKTRGNKQGQGIAKRLGQLLDHQPAALDVDGHKVVSIRQEFDQAVPDPDPQIRHHVQRYRVCTSQEEE